MNFLLDTHLLLWAAGSNPLLPADAATLIRSEENVLFFSPASIWEVAIKNGARRDDFHTDPSVLRRGLLENGYIELPITSEHAARVAGLPPIHKDPFDRILIAQAIVEGLTLLTVDAVVGAYEGPILQL